MKTKQKKSLVSGLVLAGAVVLGSQAAMGAELGATDEPIKLALHEWTGQHITTHIAGHALTSMGYKVEYVTAGYLGAGTAIADGNLSASLEVWDNNMGDFYPKLLAEKKLEDIGDTGIDAREGWLYPAHVAEKCPGLPAWDAFNKCSQLFATAETYPKGRFLEYPADWGDRATQLIKAEGLNFSAVPAGSEGALVAELQSSVVAKTPLVMMFWAPHWVLSTTKVGWIDIPKDLQKKYGLEKPRVFKLVWPGMKSKWPAAYEMLKAMKIGNDVQEPLMNEVDNQGKDVVEVTKAWMDANEAVWKAWVKAAM